MHVKNKISLVSSSMALTAMMALTMLLPGSVKAQGPKTFTLVLSPTMTLGVRVPDEAMLMRAQDVLRTQGVSNLWLDVHEDMNGTPGPIVGWLGFNKDGSNAMMTNLDWSMLASMDKVILMLHYDRGQLGIMEYPGGADIPVMMDDGTPVMAEVTLNMSNMTATSSIQSNSLEKTTTTPNTMIY
jgi:hypothetical protein